MGQEFTEKQLRFTQNFLKSQDLVKRLVHLAKIEPGSTLLEIGPGKGIITAELARRVTAGGRVVAVELDANLVEELSRKFEHIPQVEILNENILQFGLERMGGAYDLFSNVPFNITSRLLEFLFNPSTGPDKAHLILQQDAIVGKNKEGSETETFKSMLIKPLYRVRVRHRFFKSDFRPRPSVETALFSFEKRATPLIDVARYELYKDFLAFVSKDRVGEGAWLKLFSKRQIKRLVSQSGLMPNRGLKSQTVEAVVAAFDLFAALGGAKQKRVLGAMRMLRDEQSRMTEIAQAGGHHRSKKGKLKK